MRIEATPRALRALLQLAELDAQQPDLPPETYRSRREASRRHVPRSLLARYETLVEVGRFPVVVAIHRGGCSGCHVRLPTAVEYESRRTAGLYDCPHCHRMLYAAQWLGDARDAATEAGGRRAHCEAR